MKIPKGFRPVKNYKTEGKWYVAGEALFSGDCLKIVENKVYRWSCLESTLVSAQTVLMHDPVFCWPLDADPVFNIEMPHLKK
jgi:hypothetical protein